VPHDLDKLHDERAISETPIGRLLDKLLYDRLMTRLTPTWIDDIINRDMRERVDRVAAMVMGKLLTRNYRDVNTYIATRIAERLTKKDFAKMVDVAVRDMLKTHGAELEAAAKAAVQDAIASAAAKQFKATLKTQAENKLNTLVTEALDEACLLPEQMREDLARSESDDDEES